MNSTISFWGLHPVLGSLAVLVFGLFLTFFTKLYRARCRMVDLKNAGLAMPPYSLLFGHLLTVKAVMSKLPSDARGNHIPRCLTASYPDLGPIFYLDLWPFGPQMLVVTSPAALYQMTQEHSLPKYHALREFLRPMTGEYDLVSMEGEMWREWRSIFNPGFSSGNLMAFVPAILEDTLTFCEILQKHVDKGDLVSFKTLTDNLTMDVIGTIILDARFNSQRSANALAIALRRQIPWLTFGTEYDRYTLLRPLIRWFNTRQMDAYIAGELEGRFADPDIIHHPDKPERRRPVIDLAFRSSQLEKSWVKRNKWTPAAFKSFVISQVKMLIFAGHDTTSSTICYVLYLLSCNPSALERVCAEHDDVFGSDVAETSSAIREAPHLLNQLPFTVAVIKETLRLFPPSSSTRAGEPGFSIVDSNGRNYPTNGFMVWSNHQATHSDPSYWPHPASFLPERWLATPGDILYPVKGAWRPFEYGPRNCIGQELTMIEIKIVMVMTLRKFSVQSAYQEWDELKSKTGPNTVEGEIAYQVGIGEPRGGLPCRIRIAKR